MDTKEENLRQIKTMTENFRFLRESRGWSLKDLSDISGIDEKILADIEGGSDFDVAHLFKLCGIYRVRPREIFSPLR